MASPLFSEEGAGERVPSAGGTMDNIDTSNESIIMAHSAASGSQTPSYSGVGGGTSHIVMSCWGP
jgi:acyl CoA:acetate/3-ketoacid CoA transferase beta subunit